MLGVMEDVWFTALRIQLVSCHNFLSLQWLTNSMIDSIVTQTVSSAPSGYSAAKMPNDLAAGYALTASIPIPTIPTTFFPGQVPATKRAYP